MSNIPMRFLLPPLMAVLVSSGNAAVADAYVDALQAEARGGQQIRLAQAASDPYVDALKAELKGEARAKAAPPKPVQSPPPRNTRATLRTDDQVQMEQWLHQEYVGTYAFYKKLSDTRKQTVYRLYREGAPIEELRTKINELLIKK